MLVVNKSEMKRLLLVGSSVDISKIDFKDTFIVTIQLSDELELSKTTSNVRLLHRQAQNKIWNEIVNYSKRWLDNPYDNSLKIQDVPLWDFFYDEVFETHGGIFEAIYYVKTILSLIEEISPNKIETIGSFELDLDKILQTISKKHNIEFTSNSKVINLAKPKRNKTFSKIFFFCRFMFGKIALITYQNKNDSNFILTHGSYATKTKETLTDLYLVGLHDYIIRSGKKPLVISLNLPRIHQNILFDVLHDIWNIVTGQYRPFSAYLSLNDIFISKKNENHVDIKSLVDDLPELIIDGIEIIPLVRQNISDHLQERIHDLMISIEACRKYIDHESPKKILNVEGFNLFGKVLATMCNEKGIEIFMPQLGIISRELPVNPGFFIPKNFNHKIIPTIFVWGNYHKKILVDRGYPESKIVVGGFYRSYKKNITKKNLENYVLYIAGANIRVGEYISSINEECTTINEIASIVPPTMTVMVKLHPTHPFTLFKQGLNHSNITVIGNDEYDMEELIMNASVITGKCSTLMLQSILIGKKVITINLSSDIDFCGLQLPFYNSIESFKTQLCNLSDNTVMNSVNEEICSIVGLESSKRILEKFYEK